MTDPVESQQESQAEIHMSQTQASQFQNSSNSRTFGPKLSIKLNKNNFIHCNQKIEGGILYDKLHKFP